MTPDEEHVAFYHELGLTITQWAHVEIALANTVAACCLKDADVGRVANAFYSIENFRSKLAFCDALMSEVHKDRPVLDLWKALSTRLSAAASKRNKLAHHRVIVYSQSTPGRRNAIVPWYVDKPKKKSKKNLPPQGALCVRDINAIRFEFAALYCSLIRFSWKLRGAGAQEPFPESYEQPMRPNSIPQLRGQIHAILGHPQQPSRKSP